MGPKQPVSIAGLEFDAVIDSSEDYSASVPEYPVDLGYSVSDNVALSPMVLAMTLYVTATPVTWLSSHGSGEQRIKLLCDELIDLYASRSLLSVYTPDQVFDNMVIRDVSIKSTAEIGYAREIPISLVQVTITEAGTAFVPASYLRAGASMESTGSAGNTSAGRIRPSTVAMGSSSETSGGLTEILSRGIAVAIDDSTNGGVVKTLCNTVGVVMDYVSNSGSR